MSMPTSALAHWLRLDTPQYAPYGSSSWKHERELIKDCQLSGMCSRRRSEVQPR